jgi:cytochrome c553
MIVRWLDSNENQKAGLGKLLGVPTSYITKWTTYKEKLSPYYIERILMKLANLSSQDISELAEALNAAPVTVKKILELIRMKDGAGKKMFCSMVDQIYDREISSKK